MFVYVQWFAHGIHHIQGFHKIEKAIDHVLDHIENCITNGPNGYVLEKKKKSVSAYFQPVQDAGGPLNEVLDMPDIAPIAPPPAPRARPAVLGGDLAGPAVNMHVGVYNAPSAPVASGSSSESKELNKLRYYMEVAKKDRTMENTVKVIRMYDDYAKASLGYDVALHELQEVKVAT